MPEYKYPDYLTFDIGGANIKSACLHIDGKQEAHISCDKHTFPMWQKSKQLKDFFLSYQGRINCSHVKSIAVSITAELSDIFKRKRDGVGYILGVLDAVFPDQDVYVYSKHGEFISTNKACNQPLDAAAANWLPSAQLASRILHEGVFIDIGSTTADLIPFSKYKILARGFTDPERLVSGELVYTGVLRTPANHLADKVPFRGEYCRVSPEYFAITGDIHVILGNIGPESYNWPTPDKRSTSVSDAMSRLAKVICADDEILSAGEIRRMAAYFFDKQIQQISEALQQILSRFGKPLPLLAVGEGVFLAKTVGERLGLKFYELSNFLKKEQIDHFTVWSLAVLLAEFKEGGSFFGEQIEDFTESRR